MAKNIDLVLQPMNLFNQGIMFELSDDPFRFFYHVFMTVMALHPFAMTTLHQKAMECKRNENENVSTLSRLEKS